MYLAFLLSAALHELAALGPVEELLAKQNSFHVLVDLAHERPRRPLAAFLRIATVALVCEQKILNQL